MGRESSADGEDEGADEYDDEDDDEHGDNEQIRQYLRDHGVAPPYPYTLMEMVRWRHWWGLGTPEPDSGNDYDEDMDDEEEDIDEDFVQFEAAYPDIKVDEHSIWMHFNKDLWPKLDLSKPYVASMVRWAWDGSMAVGFPGPSHEHLVEFQKAKRESLKSSTCDETEAYHNWINHGSTRAENVHVHHVHASPMVVIERSHHAREELARVDDLRSFLKELEEEADLNSQAWEEGTEWSGFSS